MFCFEIEKLKKKHYKYPYLPGRKLQERNINLRINLFKRDRKRSQAPGPHFTACCPFYRKSLLIRLPFRSLAVFVFCLIPTKVTPDRVSTILLATKL